MISILIPIYNGIEYISESIQSILDQTFQDWEVIIAINGHAENSFIYQIAKDYETVDNRIRVYDMHELRGKATTMNAMIGLCKYDYIAILDVDDIWLPEKLEKQAELLKKNHYDVVGTKCVYFENLDGVIANIPVGDITTFNFKEVNPIINSSAVLRKELATWNENFNTGVEDYELWVRLWMQGKQFFNFEDVLVKHRVHQNSAFNTQDHSAKIARIKEY